MTQFINRYGKRKEEDHESSVRTMGKVSIVCLKPIRQYQK